MTALASTRLVYSADDLALALGMPVGTVRERCKRGEYEARKDGRLWRIPRREYIRLVGEDAPGHEAGGGDAELRRRERALREIRDVALELVKRCDRALGD